MMTLTNPMTAQIPSAFGMPVVGCARTTAARIVVSRVEATIVDDRKGGFASDLGLIPDSFWGTTAWRPPIC